MVDFSVGIFGFFAVFVRVLAMETIGDLKIEPATWAAYERFKSLCCVDTKVFGRWRCWTVEGDKAFIGYDYSFRNSSRRLEVFPDLKGESKEIQLRWVNFNVRILSRVMVRPEFRGQGIATQLIRQTLPIVGVPFVECLTFTELIARSLFNCGFDCYGPQDTRTCDYYLWRNPVKQSNVSTYAHRVSGS